MNNQIIFIAAYILLAFHVWITCRLAVESILKLGRSKNGYKKLKKNKTKFEKIFYIKYLDLAKYEKGKLKFFIFVNNFYVVYTFLFIIITLCSILISIFYLINLILLIIKCLIVDLPYSIIFILQTCHAPNGGVEWKFERDYRKSRKKK